MPASARSFSSKLSYNSPLPALATGAVIPPNQEFAAVLGDQRYGRNLEAPEGLIRQIIQEEMRDVLMEIRDALSGRGGIAGGRPLNVTMETDGKQWARVHLPYINGEDTRIGVSMSSI